MRQEHRFTLTIALVAAFAWFSASHANDDTQPANADSLKEHPKSKLYDSFDPQKLMEKHVSRFDATPRHTNVVTNITITPPGDIFKLFRIKGNISDADLDQMLSSIQTELTNLAKTSGVKVTRGPKDKIGDRPIQLLTVLFLGETVQLKTLRGFTFTYEDGKILGAVDAFVARCVDEDTKEWKVVCTVHEQVR